LVNFVLCKEKFTKLICQITNGSGLLRMSLRLKVVGDRIFTHGARFLTPFSTWFARVASGAHFRTICRRGRPSITTSVYGAWMGRGFVSTWCFLGWCALRLAVIPNLVRALWTVKRSRLQAWEGSVAMTEPRRSKDGNDICWWIPKVCYSKSLSTVLISPTAMASGISSQGCRIASPASSIFGWMVATTARAEERIG